MITINGKKNSDTNSVNAEFTEGAVNKIFSDLNKQNADNLDRLDKIAAPVKSELSSMKTYSDELAKAAKNIDGAISSTTTDRRSIIARAKNSVLQFPIYMVNTVNISAAHTVAKTFERVYASFVQTTLSQYPIVDENSINDLAFLRQFHTNLKESTNSLFNEYYQPIDDFDQIMQESIHNTLMCDNGIIATFDAVPATNAYLIAENARLINDPLTGFENFFAESDAAEMRREDNEERIESYGLNEKDLEETFGKKKPVEPEKPEKPEDVRPPKPVRHDQETDNHYEDRMHQWQNKLDKMDEDYLNAKAKYDRDKKKYDDDIKKYNDEFESFKNDIKEGKTSYHFKGKKIVYNKDKKNFFTNNRSIENKKSNVEIKAPVLLKDTDIKKINGMLPYTFDASFMLKSSGSNSGNIVHYIIGVKSVLHLIQPKDLSNDLQDLITGDIKNLQKVRYKTGEISFWKDYIFRKDALKSDASKHLDGSKRWINTLKHLADYNKQHGGMLDKPASMLAGGDIPIPNGTLVLTQPDVLRMKSDTGINLEDVGMAKKLARNLFMIAIVILDSSAGTMKVLFTDTDTNWDIQSLSSIEAEVARTDNSNFLKELKSVINK